MTDIELIRTELRKLVATPLENSTSDAKSELGSETEQQRRTICVRFYITPAEETKLNKLTDGVKNRSRWIRAKLFQQALPQPQPKIPEVNREVYITTKYIRSETNQIARALNTALSQKQLLPLSQDYLNTLKEMQTTLDLIGRELVKINATHRTDNGINP